jgi:cyanophycin synthetase
MQKLDEPALRVLAAAGFSPDSVPAKGAVVLLRKMETAEASGLPEDITAAVHPANAAIAVRGRFARPQGRRH